MKSALLRTLPLSTTALLVASTEVQAGTNKTLAPTPAVERPTLSPSYYPTSFPTPTFPTPTIPTPTIPTPTIPTPTYDYTPSYNGYRNPIPKDDVYEIYDKPSYGLSRPTYYSMNYDLLEEFDGDSGIGWNGSGKVSNGSSGKSGKSSGWDYYDDDAYDAWRGDKSDKGSSGKSGKGSGKSGKGSSGKSGKSSGKSSKGSSGKSGKSSGKSSSGKSGKSYASGGWNR
ncbi:hypothetical protein ACHAWX_004928 [Stephanocyclus meneghinianus]